jgi:hypothetical protein
MFERNISVNWLLRAIESEETIEDYSSEMPDPSRLILGFQGKRPFHVVCTENLQAKLITIITVYIHEPARWSKDFRRRRP